MTYTTEELQAMIEDGGLYLRDTGVTDLAIADLRRALPNLHIHS